MKIQRSDIRRFLQHERKMWRSNYESDSQIVVFTFTERSCSIEKAREGLLLTCFFNLDDVETNERVIAVPSELLHDCSNGTGSSMGSNQIHQANIKPERVGASCRGEFDKDAIRPSATKHGPYMAEIVPFPACRLAIVLVN